MWTALVRAHRTVPVESSEELRREKRTVAVLVTRPGCAGCETFESSGDMYRASQALARHDVGPLLHWSCSDAASTDAAERMGVDDIPAIVVLTSKAAVRGGSRDHHILDAKEAVHFRPE